MSKCVMCGNESEFSLEIKGKTYCDECVDEHFFMCMLCTDLEPRSEVIEDHDEGEICKACAESIANEGR